MFKLSSYTSSEGNHWPDANAGDDLYYSIDFSTWLTAEGDTLSSVSWTLPDEITSSDEFVDSNKAYIKLLTATAGKHTIKCTLQSTDAGKTQTNVVPIILEVYK